MKYTGINIGPIVPTISMGRKPREIWAASYMFSFLMECIVNEVLEDAVIVSPAVNTKKNIGVGLYPDRLFIQGEFDVQSVVNEALKKFSDETKIDSDYINVMYATIEGDDSSKDKDSIKRLNQLLDCTELCNRPVQSISRDKVLKLIKKKKDSKLFEHAHNDENFPIPYLAEIATARLEKLNPKDWSKLRDKYQGKDSYNDGNEDAFYQELKNDFKDIYNENSWLQIEICNEKGYFEGLIEIDMEGYGVEHTIEEATYQLKYDYKIQG